jgi:hypothetical protein
MRPVTRLALVGVVALCATALAAADEITIPRGSSDGAPPTYSNAQVVAVDVTGRTLLIRRNAKGVEEKVQLDDNLAGIGDIRAGDRVILTVRTGPGWTRVSSIVKSRPLAASRPPAAPKAAATSSASPAQAPVTDPQLLASRQTFADQIAGLAEQADQIDRVWNEFRRACDFGAGHPNEAARGWFVIWEGSIRADLSGGFCRDLFNQIVDLGEPIRAGMTAADNVARRSLLPGDMRDIRRQYRMDWDSWALTSPKRLEP